MLRRCARKMAASFIQRMSAAFYGHADHCSRDVVFFDCVRRRLLAWTDAGVLAGTKAWRDDGYSLRGAFSTYCDRACRSMTSQKVQHKNERSFARRSRSRWSVSAAARGRCCRKPPSRDYTGSTAQPPSDTGGPHLHGVASRVCCHARFGKLASPQRRECAVDRAQPVGRRWIE